MVQDIGGHIQRRDIIKGDTLLRLQAVNRHMADLGATAEDITERVRGGALGLRALHHRQTAMPDTTALRPGREVQGLS